MSGAVASGATSGTRRMRRHVYTRKWLSKATPVMSFLPDMSAYWTRPVRCWFEADDYIVILCGVLVVGVLFAGECKVRGHTSRNVNEWTVAYRDTVTASPPPSPGSLSLCLSSCTCDIPPKPQLLSGLASTTKLHGTISRDCPKIRLVHLSSPESCSRMVNNTARRKPVPNLLGERWDIEVLAQCNGIRDFHEARAA